MNRKLARSVIVRLTLLCLVASAPLCSRAQDSATTATLAGTVHDAAGAIIPGAAITLRNITTNQTRNGAAGSDGSYRIAGLPVGDCEVRVEASGFAPYSNTKITLLLGRTVTLEVTLNPAGISVEVKVTEQPPALDTTSTASTTSIDPERIEELPINSRNYLAGKSDGP